MKYEIRKTKENGVIQITTADERWYYFEKENKFRKSVTWVAGCYPKGVAYYKWLADKGWDEAEAIKQAAGQKGSKVHQAIEQLLFGNPVNMSSKFKNSESIEEELTVEEYECLMSFVDWFTATKPTILRTEQIIWSDAYDCAGTLDFICTIDNQTYIVDFKTSQYVWPEYEIQLTAYKACAIERKLVDENVKLAILQIGYRKNQRQWKFNEINDKEGLFLAALTIWNNEHATEKPSQRDYSQILQLKGITHGSTSTLSKDIPQGLFGENQTESRQTNTKRRRTKN